MKFLAALTRARDLVSESEESDWDAVPIEKVEATLSRAVSKLEAKKGLGFVMRFRLRLLFAPTSSLQEISMVNGWHDEYLEIADVVDRHIGASWQ